MNAQLLEEKLKNFVLATQYPCLGAKSVVNTNSFNIHQYAKLGTEDAAEFLARDLRDFISKRRAIGGKFATFIAVFESPKSVSEKRFENLLWKQLSFLTSKDEQDWNEDISSNPVDNNFGFSFDGTAFFIVGLHDSSSRFARRFTNPTLVFNPHDQFDYLRESGKYTKMQSTIRKRDIAL